MMIDSETYYENEIKGKKRRRNQKAHRKIEKKNQRAEIYRRASKLYSEDASKRENTNFMLSRISSAR